MSAEKQGNQASLARRLAEWIVVAIVIVLFASMLIPGSRHGLPAQRIQAKLEMVALVQAIEAYQLAYDHLPLLDTATNQDLTCGISGFDIQDFKPIDGTRLVASNSDLIIVLMDLDLGINADHKLNPQQIKFLNAKMVEGTNSPGVSIIDHEYRDPWGHPYVISVDVNLDGFVRDAMYARAALYPHDAVEPLTKRNGLYELSGKVMVWSRGRDGKVSASEPANSGVNKDNLRSWRSP